MFRFTHKLEGLEQRNLLAADGSVSVLGGSLFINGTVADDTVEVRAGSDADSYVISGIDLGEDTAGLKNGNGDNDGLLGGLLSSISDRFRGSVQPNPDGTITASGARRGIFINLGAGNDTVALDGVDVRQNVHVSTGAGDDRVLLAGSLSDDSSPATVAADDASDATASDGGEVAAVDGTDDTVGLRVGGNLRINIGEGNDVVASGSFEADSSTGGTASNGLTEGMIHVRGNLVVETGAGEDQVMLGHMDTTDGTTPDDGISDNADDSSIAALSVGGNLHVRTGAGLDQLTIGSTTNTAGETGNKATDINTGTGTDSTGSSTDDTSVSNSGADQSTTNGELVASATMTDGIGEAVTDSTTDGMTTNGTTTRSDSTVTGTTGTHTTAPNDSSDNSSNTRLGTISRLLDNIQNRVGRGDRFFDRIYDRFQDGNLPVDNFNGDRLAGVIDRVRDNLPSFNPDQVEEQVRGLANRIGLTDETLTRVRDTVGQVMDDLRGGGSDDDDDGTAVDANVQVGGNVQIDTGADNDVVAIAGLHSDRQLNVQTSAGDDQVTLSAATVDRLMASLGEGADGLDIIQTTVDNVTRLLGGEGQDTFESDDSSDLGRLVPVGFEPQLTLV